MALSIFNSFRPVPSAIWGTGNLSNIFQRMTNESFEHSAWILGGVRGKKKLASGSTRNKCGFPRGKKRGIKVYDGQRVPFGSTLVDQIHMTWHPGLNTRFGNRCNIMATTHGRVMITAERTNLDFENNDYVQKHYNENLKGRNVFKTTIHVLPDVQHQYFKLMDTV